MFRFRGHSKRFLGRKAVHSLSTGLVWKKCHAPVDFAASGSTSRWSQGWSPGSEPENLRGETTMRFMVIVKATKDSEAGKMPSEELLSAMAKFNEEMMKAGVMLDGN